ncbi:MAG: hypothetical protein J6S60_07240 [Oscillospiraceae bacterium]|nr:hypothetical protein [Oscillospiraceae bacterium]
MTTTKPIYLLTIDLSMFGEGGEGAATAGEASAPAAAAAPAPAEVRYGKQPEQTAAPQQETQTPTPDKGKLFSDLIKGEFKEQYTEATQRLINRRFRDTDAKIQAMQPVIDMLDQRYSAGGDVSKIAQMLEADSAFWEAAAEREGKTPEQYMADVKKDIMIQKLTERTRQQDAIYLANLQYQQWAQEAGPMQEKYPGFDLNAALENDVFTLMLKNKYPMEQAYKAAFADQIAAQAAASMEKAVTDNIKARGSRPTEAGANNAPAFQVKDDPSKLTDKEVLEILSKDLRKERISFG